MEPVVGSLHPPRYPYHQRRTEYRGYEANRYFGGHEGQSRHLVRIEHYQGPCGDGNGHHGPSVVANHQPDDVGREQAHEADHAGQGYSGAGQYPSGGHGQQSSVPGAGPQLSSQSVAQHQEVQPTCRQDRQYNPESKVWNDRHHVVPASVGQATADHPLNPYSIPSTGIFICSSSTPPGPPSAPPPAEFRNATAFVLIGRRPGVHRPTPVLGSGRHPEKTTSTVDLRRLYDGFALPTCPGPSLPPPAAAVAMVNWEVILGYLNDIRGMLSQGSLPEQRALLASFLRSVNWHDSVSSGGVH